MKIGELAKAAHVEVETIRYYERIGLLPAPSRSPNGYRAFAVGHICLLYTSDAADDNTCVAIGR